MSRIADADRYRLISWVVYRLTHAGHDSDYYSIAAVMRFLQEVLGLGLGYEFVDLESHELREDLARMADERLLEIVIRDALGDAAFCFEARVPRRFIVKGPRPFRIDLCESLKPLLERSTPQQIALASTIIGR